MGIYGNLRIPKVAPMEQLSPAIPLLVLMGLAAAVALPLALAELRFRSRWEDRLQIEDGVSPKAGGLRDIEDALESLTRVAPPEATPDILRVVLVGPKLNLLGWTQVERAWSPWGSRAIVVRLVVGALKGTRDELGPVLIHECVQHVLPIMRGEGGNPSHNRRDLMELQDEVSSDYWMKRHGRAGALLFDLEGREVPRA